MIVDGVARLCPKWMSPQSSLTCIATDRVELSQNSSRYVRACPPMTSLRPLEICRSTVGSDDLRDKHIPNELCGIWRKGRIRQMQLFTVLRLIEKLR